MQKLNEAAQFYNADVKYFKYEKYTYLYILKHKQNLQHIADIVHSIDSCVAVEYDFFLMFC